MALQRAVPTGVLSQPFGGDFHTLVNGVMIGEPSGYYTKDAKGYLKSRHTKYVGATGYQKFFHNGRDEYLPISPAKRIGKPLLSPESGEIVHWQPEYGYVTVQIRPGSYIAIAHCNSIWGHKIGDPVVRGIVFASIGNKAGPGQYTTGPHAHQEVMFDELGAKMYYDIARFWPGGDMANDPRILPLQVTPIGAVANIRADPSTAAKILGTLSAGVTLPAPRSVLGVAVNGNPHWYKVIWQGKWGYISATVSKIS